MLSYVNRNITPEIWMLEFLQIDKNGTTGNNVLKIWFGEDYGESSYFSYR